MIPFKLESDNKDKIINLCAKLKNRLDNKIATVEDLEDISKVLEYFEESFAGVDAYKAEISALEDQISDLEDGHCDEVTELEQEIIDLQEELDDLREANKETVA